MFRKDTFYKIGWLFLPVMIIVAPLLPDYFGKENGIIENIQLLQLAAGFVFCLKLRNTDQKLNNIPLKYLWQAGAIVFFMMFMREISWGRAFFFHPDGRMYSYKDLGLYGKLVHPAVGLLLAALLFLLYKCRIWKLVQQVKFPASSTLLLVIYIILQYIGEHCNLAFFHGEVAEELCESACYQMIFYIVYDVKREIDKILSIK